MSTLDRMEVFHSVHRRSMPHMGQFTSTLLRGVLVHASEEFPALILRETLYSPRKPRRCRVSVAVENGTRMAAKREHSSMIWKTGISITESRGRTISFPLARRFNQYCLDHAGLSYIRNRGRGDARKQSRVSSGDDPG